MSGWLAIRDSNVLLLLGLGALAGSPRRAFARRPPSARLRTCKAHDRPSKTEPGRLRWQQNCLSYGLAGGAESIAHWNPSWQILEADVSSRVLLLESVASSLIAMLAMPAASTSCAPCLAPRPALRDHQLST